MSVSMKGSSSLARQQRATELSVRAIQSLTRLSWLRSSCANVAFCSPSPLASLNAVAGLPLQPALGHHASVQEGASTSDPGSSPSNWRPLPKALGEGLERIGSSEDLGSGAKKNATCDVLKS